jgi:hypothetical protein
MSSASVGLGPFRPKGRDDLAFPVAIDNKKNTMST